MHTRGVSLVVAENVNVKLPPPIDELKDPSMEGALNIKEEIAQVVLPFLYFPFHLSSIIVIRQTFLGHRLLRLTMMSTTDNVVLLKSPTSRLKVQVLLRSFAHFHRLYFCITLQFSVTSLIMRSRSICSPTTNTRLLGNL
ncbi:uncharacterized protein LY89DRAFT_151733 [Mollisia scopiformis]|uniref:Uncharacterized protein n=1 Tax=Mollisia scopiformis TaxID=149040 RepID=A0A194X1C3_MOLSC|nr:uncharacterized protein LY89DRAFT_151733 [Mollisia scopiformis]KUJ13995.1 hypothetical protein LY89DRAFT_151733 [Mollisia scopiformis]